ncbi:helix-turn-helix domain-containing protein [Glycomyces xiaoerkulensis]|uniref:helix-turn-helix domain-containing protein n=1 Tax=Glycomyces xiaoerkulensis TaxID=2038139 RepID=UPI000C26BC0C|nr:helix-turn-helix transcriptional regulator [Glycomyces xiaoerkulensis]
MQAARSTAVERLRAARVRSGLSQSEVAARIGTTQSAIARLESGASDPRLSTLERFADVVGVKLGVRSEHSRMSSLEFTAAQIRRSLAEHDSAEAFRQVVQFVDDIRRADAAAVRRAVRIEPESTGDKRWDAMLAGIAEYVSRGVGLPVPGWASAPGRFLRRSWFVIEDIIERPSPGLAVLAFASSPPELAARGVLIDRTSLESV